MRNRILAVLLAVLLVLFGSGSAYADDYPAYVPGEGLNDYGNGHYMLAPVSNAFNAALWLMGENDKYPQLTDEQLALLSNEDTGGAFYDLALKFSSVADQGYPSWAEINPLDVSTWTVYMDFYICSSAYGESHVWYCTADNADIQNARRDFLKVYNGEVTLPTSDSAVTVYFTSSNWGSSSKFGDYTFSPSQAKSESLSLLPATASFEYPDTLFDILPENLKDYDRVFQFSSGRLICYLFKPGTYNITSTTFTYDGKDYVTGGTITHTDDSAYYQCYGYKIGTSTEAGSISQSDISFDGSTFRLNLPHGATFRTVEREYTLNSVLYGFMSGATIVYPPNNWPDPTPPQPQPEPDPPEVPQPPDLPGPPENPTIDPPTVEPEPTGTTPTDYTPWLRAIFNALNRLITDLANHCFHIRSYMRTCTNYIASCFSHLEGYMRDCFEWLADQFEFDAGNAEYDVASLLRVLLEINKVLGDIYGRLGDLDSAISDLSAQLGDIYIRLGQILGKIGSGGGGRPTPTTEPEVDEGFDFWQWLLDLISSKLDAIIEDFVGDIGGFLSELVTKFPFSIPWDIAAYLTLLDAQRVTPVISFVIPAIGGWWGEVPITVDLQPYDNAMAAVRSMMLILWGFCLIMRTDWLGGVFDGAVQVVTSFFDRLTGHGGGA